MPELLRGSRHRTTGEQRTVRPALNGTYYDGEWVTRAGDVITAGPQLYGDSGDHPGHTRWDTARIALYRDGALVKQSPRAGDQFVVPAAATYRLESAVSQSVSDLSTQVSSVWTFRSGPVTGGTPDRLPIQVVRSAPSWSPTSARCTAVVP